MNSTDFNCRIPIAGLILLALASLCTGSVQAQTFGLMLIGEDTVLTQDHYGSIVISADDVTLDCDEHLIISDDPGNTWGVSSGLNNITVRNCHAVDHRVGFGFNLTSNLTLRNNSARGSTWCGFCVDHTERAMLISNVATDNHYGMIVGRSSGVTLIGNTANWNVEGGFDAVLDQDCSLISNNADDNVYFGLSLRDSGNCRVIHNVACGNGAADARLIRGFDNLFQANQFCTTSGL